MEYFYRGMRSGKLKGSVGRLLHFRVYLKLSHARTGKVALRLCNSNPKTSIWLPSPQGHNNPHIHIAHIEGPDRIAQTETAHITRCVIVRKGVN